MDYGGLLSRSWNIVWNNKFLFILGFLAALGGGGGGGGADFQTGSPPGPGAFGEFTEQLQTFWTQYGGLILAGVCFLFILSIVLWLVRLTAQGSLIDAAARLDDAETVTFGDAWGAGVAKLGRLVGIHLLLYGPIILLGIVTAAIAIFSVLASGPAGPSEDLVGLFVACFVCLICPVILYLIIVSVLSPFAQRAAVLHDHSVLSSIRYGWQVIRENLGEVAVLIFLFIVISILFGIAMLIVLLPLTLVALGPALFGAIMRGSFEVVDLVLAVGGGICIGLVGAAISSILVSFRSTAFTLAYKEFTGYGKAGGVVEGEVATT